MAARGGWCDRPLHASAEDTTTGAPDMDRSPDIGHIGLGLLLTGARAGLALSRVAFVPARLAMHAPLVGGALERATQRLERDGEQGVARARTHAVALTEEVLGTPELADVAESVLAGPLTDAIARAVGEHHVVERVATQVLRDADLERIVDAVLADPRTEQTLVRVLDSSLIDALTNRVLESPEMQRIVEHIAQSPEVLAAVRDQTHSFAGEVVADVRTRSEHADDAVERRVRRILRRPPRPEAT